MSNSKDGDTSILGKRARPEKAGEESSTGVVAPPSASSVVEEDGSDNDDVGPMPMPADAANGSIKKKRKGVSVSKPSSPSSWIGSRSSKFYPMSNFSWIISRARTNTTRVSCTAT